MGAWFSVVAGGWIGVILRHFANSDYFTAMLALSAAGVARDAAAKSGAVLLAWIVRRLWVTIRLEEKDAELVLAWLRDRSEVRASSRLVLHTSSTSSEGKRVCEYEPEIQTTTRLRYTTKGGDNRWIWITRNEKSEGLDRRLPGAVVSFFGQNKGMLENILEAGREIQRRKREKYLTVVQVYDYGKDHGLNWLHPQDKDRKQPGRSISSVVLPRCSVTGLDQAEALLEDAREFLASEQWYTERGIPYRRGYLLHGSPGGGKSSLVMAVASELRLPIYMLQLSSEQMTDETLNTLLRYGMHDPPTILLLEDVDLLHSAVLHRRSAEKVVAERAELGNGRDADSADERKRRGRLTLGGLLNALDGPTATVGRLLFMTTNAMDRLDPALLRSGRIDYQLEFTSAVPEQVERLFARFYSDFRSSHGVGERSIAVDGGTELAKVFSEALATSGMQLTTADVQSHLLKYKTDPEAALRELPTLLRTLNPMSLALPSVAEPPSPQVGSREVASQPGSSVAFRPESEDLKLDSLMASLEETPHSMLQPPRSPRPSRSPRSTRSPWPSPRPLHRPDPLDSVLESIWTSLDAEPVAVSPEVLTPEPEASPQHLPEKPFVDPFPSFHDNSLLESVLASLTTEEPSARPHSVEPERPLVAFTDPELAALLEPPDLAPHRHEPASAAATDAIEEASPMGPFRRALLASSRTVVQDEAASPKVALQARASASSEHVPLGPLGRAIRSTRPD